LSQLRFESIDLPLQIKQGTAQLSNGLILSLILRLDILLDQGACGVLGLLQTLAQIQDGPTRFVIPAEQGRLRRRGQDGQDKTQDQGGRAPARSNMFHKRPQ
jgi:hypothetical protein